MLRRLILSIALAGACSWQVQGDSPPDTIESKIGERKVQMVLTGSAVRTRSIFKVYEIKCYIEKGHGIRTAADMIRADAPKQLHLVMLRGIPGPEMADAFSNMLRLNHPAPAFAEEVKTVADILRSRTAKKGDEIWFTHVPRVGFEWRVPGGMVHLIRNVDFSRAVWENYFGKHNAGEHVKQGLLARLPLEKSQP
jgi:hypothetical protein